MGSRVEAVVADLDGTLVAPDSSVSAATIEALGAIRAAGIPLVIATGRAPVEMGGLTALTRCAEITVCCSGAIGSAGPRRLWQSHLAPATAGRVAGTAERYGAGVAGFDGVTWHATKMYRALDPGGGATADVTSRALSRVRCVAMAVVHTGRTVDALMEIGLALAGHDVRTGLSRVAGLPILDVTPPLVDKGTGVRRALDALGANPAAVVSFGDMPNDIPMFTVTGWAYAVGPGHPAVAAAARETLDPVEQDGFARKIFDLAASDWRLP